MTIYNIFGRIDITGDYHLFKDVNPETRLAQDRWNRAGFEPSPSQVWAETATATPHDPIFTSMKNGAYERATYGLRESNFIILTCNCCTDSARSTSVPRTVLASSVLTPHFPVDLLNDHAEHTCTILVYKDDLTGDCQLVSKLPRKAQKKSTRQDPKKRAAEDTRAASDDEVNRRCTHLQRASTACTRQRGNRTEIVRCKHVQLTYHLRNVRCTQPLTVRRVVQTTYVHLASDVLPRPATLLFLYGAESWTLTRSLKQKLNSFDTQCLRKIEGIRWQDQVTNEAVRYTTNQVPISQRITKHQLNLLGHMSRATPTQEVIKPITTALDPIWRRPRGRPRSRWEDRVFNVLGSLGVSRTDLSALAENRTSWRDMATAAMHQP
ncbi:hypothetical protein Bbelb_021200 [Branchiostoma belcheri]|nr:hypothetical protein Bbelb_021200 [Branchiostoma belcheri]